MAKRRNQQGVEEEIIETVQYTEEHRGVESWFEKNKTLVLGLMAGLLLLIAAFVIFKFFIKEPKEQSAKAAIYKAEQQFQQDSFALALENPGGGFEGLLDIIDNYGGTKTANLAKLYAGVSYLNLGRFDEAISYLDSHSTAGNYSAITKNGNLGDAYSEQGEFEKAQGFYQKATTAGEDALLTPYYLYKLGLLAKRNGDNSTALSAFQKIKAKYPTSNEGSTIDMLIRAVSS